MGEVADGDILADVELEVAAARGDDEGAFDGRRPDEIAVNDALDVFEYGIAVIAGFGEGGVFIGSEQDRVGAVDADEAQLAQRVGDRIGIIAHIGGKRVDWIAGAFANALDVRFARSR